MRKINNRIVKGMIILFLLHALMGSLMLLGYSTISFSYLSWLLLILVALHGGMGIIASIKAIISGKTSGKWYLKENKAFWIKRISGLFIALLLVFHITAYTTNINGHFFLKEFTTFRMITQILLILAIFIHLAVSIKSMLIARGVIQFKEKTFDWMLVLSMMMIFFTVSVILYYIQWQM